MDLLYRWLGFYVKDWKKMVAFLRDTLELKLQSEDNDSTLFVTANGFQIEIFDAAQQPNAEQLLASQNHLMIGFNVSDLDATVATLKDRGVNFDMEVQTRAWGKFVYFSDPELNQWQLFQYNRKKEKETAAESKSS
ncbi:MAG: VOC family protein [Anaerolineae bacterium]|nr:VOC family protein [Anaerolineae bacterium]